MSMLKRIVRAGPRLLAAAAVAVLVTAPLESAVAKPDIRALRVKPVSFNSLPGWKRDRHALAFKAFLRSCAKNRGGQDTLAKACRKARKMPKNLSNARARIFFESYFVPHKVHSTRRGLLTGYYEPELEGSRVRTRKFNVPLYRRPSDLVVLNSRKMRRAARRAGLPRKLTYARKTRNGLKPYLTREQIERGGLDGRQLEMIWLADPVDAFFLHIQGSGRIVLPDGSRIRIGFDGKNGYDYSSVGRALVRSGLMRKGEVSLDNVKAWLRKNPRLGRKAMWRNKSFIFFRELTNHARAMGPIGAQGISLIGGRSLAVDRRHYRLGLPIFLSVPNFRTEGQRNLRRLMIAQDTGTAIKGARRGDIFWGSGDRAGDIAGRTYHRGEFYVLLPRSNPVYMQTAAYEPETGALSRPVVRPVVRKLPRVKPAPPARSAPVVKPGPVSAPKASVVPARSAVVPKAETPAAIYAAQVELPAAPAEPRSRVPDFEAPGVHVFSEYKSTGYE